MSPARDSSGNQILITGSAGFIGSHQIDARLRHGHHVTACRNVDPFCARPMNDDRDIAASRSHPVPSQPILCRGDACRPSVRPGFGRCLEELVRASGGEYLIAPPDDAGNCL